MGIFVNLSSQSKPKSDLVVLEKSNSKKDSDVSTDIKPILTKGMHNNNPPLSSTDDTFEAKVKEKENEEKAKKLAEAKEKEREKENEEKAKTLAEVKEKEKEEEEKEKAKTLAQKETKEKINKVVFINAYKDDLDKNILIVPLDTHLKRVMTPENKELIQKEGITIVFPPDLNIKGLLDVNYIVDHNRDELAATKYKIKLSVVDHNKAKIIFPEKMPKSNEIEEMCFAFSKLNPPNMSIIQYFEPLNLELVLLTSPGGLTTTDGLQFRVDKSALKHEIIKEVTTPNQEAPLKPKFSYTFQNDDFMIVEKKEEVIKIMKEFESRKEKKAKVVCLKQNSQAEDLRHDYIIEFRQYCCFLPLVIYPKDSKQLLIFKSQLAGLNNEFDHIFVCKGYTVFSKSKDCCNDISLLLSEFRGGANRIRSNDKLARELIKSREIQCKPEDVLKEANNIYSEQVFQLEKIHSYISKSCPNYNIVFEPYYQQTEKTIKISKVQKNNRKFVETLTEKSDLKKDYDTNQALFKDVKLLLYKYLQQNTKP